MRKKEKEWKRNKYMFNIRIIIKKAWWGGGGYGRQIVSEGSD